MFETSQDILNLAKTVAVLGLSVALGWFIFYLAMITRQFLRIVKEMRARISKIDDLIKSLKKKIEHSTSYLFLISEGVKKLVDVIKERQHKQKEEKKKQPK